MARALRLLVLGVVAVGLTLMIAAGPSSASRTTHAQTGYGSDTVPPREIVTNASASPKTSSGGGSSGWIVIVVIGGIILIGGGAAVFFIRQGASSGA